MSLQWPRRTGDLLLVVVALVLCTGFKPVTHLRAGQSALEEPALQFAGRTYSADPNLVAAARNQRSYFHAGLIGPDAFPDIAFGQMYVHPDRRCAGKPSNCQSGVDSTFTHQWLEWLRSQAFGLYDANSADPLVRALASQSRAFYLGYAAHAAGDMWGHTLANYYAGSEWPEDLTGEAGRKQAMRHLAVEGFIGARTPQLAQGTGIAAPRDLIRRAFIWDRDPDADEPCISSREPSNATAYAQGSHFDGFLKQRGSLCQTYRHSRDDWYDWIDGYALVGTYALAWVRDIDAGLAEWPGFAEQVARDLFIVGDTDLAVEHAEEFALNHVLSMSGAPDFVGGGLDLADDLMGLLPEIVMPWQPLKEAFRDWLFQQAFGISIADLKSVLNDPSSGAVQELWGSAPGADPRPRIAQQMGLPGSPLPTAQTKFDPAAFPVFGNAVSTIRLLLMSAGEIDKLLRDQDIGPIFGNWSNAMTMAQHADILGGVQRSLDGHDSWRKSARGSVAAGCGLANYASKRYGEGLALHRDRVARERVFNVLFKSSPDPNVLCLQAFEPTEVLAAPLPAVEIAPKHAGGGGALPLCAPLQVKNNQPRQASVTYYVRVVGYCRKELPPRATRAVLFHRTGTMEIAPRASVPLNIYPACEANHARLDVYLFARIRGLPDSLLGAPSGSEVEGDLPYYRSVKPHKEFTLALKEPQTTCGPAADAALCGTLSEVNKASLPICAPDPGEGTGAYSGHQCSPPDAATLPPCPAGLDADNDGVADASDNCPAHPNRNQQDTNNTGIGDACKVLTIRPEETAGTAAVELNRLRLKLEQLAREAGLPGPGWGGPTCADCPTPWTEIMSLAQKLASALPAIPAAEFTDLLRQVVRGPRFSGSDMAISRLRFDARRRVASFSVNAAQAGTLVIELPRSLIPAWPGPVPSALVDGRRAEVRPAATGVDRVTIEIAVPVGQHAVTLSK